MRYASTGLYLAMLLLLAAAVPVRAEPFKKDRLFVGKGHWPFVALTSPRFVPAADARYLDDDDEVVGVFVDGEARAYPVRLLGFHHVVNDRIGKQPLAIVY